MIYSRISGLLMLGIGVYVVNSGEGDVTRDQNLLFIIIAVLVSIYWKICEND